MTEKIKALSLSDITYPCLIHGAKGSGASQFTISLAASLVNSGKSILYFCAFPPGKEKLLKEIGSKKSNLKIVNPGDEDWLIDQLKQAEKIDLIVIKNFETLSDPARQQLYGFDNIIISGDLNRLDTNGFAPATTILFSKLKSNYFPVLEKFVGYLCRYDLIGQIKLP